MKKIPLPDGIFEEVETFTLPNARASILKYDNFTWIVVLKRLSHPPGVKLIPCISFEHASFVFDGCLDTLKEWKN